ncbi:MAG TPA: response regulator [Gemmatimonadales bacterium]|nr:response regulator [Gemmatimonadales bacterium]
MVGDDEPRLLAVTTQVLREAGYTVFATYNGYSTSQAALMVAELDLLITNTRMADLAAPELIRRVRREKPGLPVLHIGEPLPATNDPALADVPTLPEPFTAEQLLASVSALIRPEGGPESHHPTLVPPQ